MARHAGAAAPAPPEVHMVLEPPTPQEWADPASWEVGECWLCEDDNVYVAWLGPVVVAVAYVRQRVPAYACATCLERIANRVSRSLREADGP
jgi:hypothetical protein